MNCCKCHIDLPNGGVVDSFADNWGTAPKYCKECYFEYVVRPKYELDPDEIIDATDGETSRRSQRRTHTRSRASRKHPISKSQ